VFGTHGSDDHRVEDQDPSAGRELPTETSG